MLPLSLRRPPVTFVPPPAFAPSAASAIFTGEKGPCGFLPISVSELKGLCFQLSQLGAKCLMCQTPSSVVPSAPVWRARMAAPSLLHPFGGAGDVSKSPKNKQGVTQLICNIPCRAALTFPFPQPEDSPPRCTSCGPWPLSPRGV